MPPSSYVTGQHLIIFATKNVECFRSFTHCNYETMFFRQEFNRELQFPLTWDQITPNELSLSLSFDRPTIVSFHLEQFELQYKWHSRLWKLVKRCIVS